AGDLAQDVRVVEDRTKAAALPRNPFEGRLPIAEGRDVNLFGAQHLLQLRPGHHDKIGGVPRQPVLVQCLPYRVVEMRAERIDGDGLAGNVLDAFDRTVFQDVEDRLRLIVDAVRRIGGDEVIAAGDRVDHGG